jgi:hypothetical protein
VHWLERVETRTGFAYRSFTRKKRKRKTLVAEAETLSFTHSLNKRDREEEEEEEEEEDKEEEETRVFRFNPLSLSLAIAEIFWAGIHQRLFSVAAYKLVIRLDSDLLQLRCGAQQNIAYDLFIHQSLLNFFARH